jgi:hypothetical protein
MTLNYGDLQNFITKEIERILDSLRKEKDQQGNQIIKDEIAKLAQNLEAKGFSKEKLLVVLKEIWDPADFDENNYYKGGKQLIISTIKEMMGGDANFLGNTFKGGWTKEQDQQAINEALKPYETKEQNDNKLKSYKNWEDTQKEIKPVVINATKESIKKPDGELLEQLRIIFGKDKFNPTTWKEGDKFPKERAGYFKDPKEIAEMEHQAQKDLQARDKWDIFWKKHSVSNETIEKDFWMSKYPADPDGADEYYNTAILKASQLVQGETPLDDLEKNRILKATTFYPFSDKIKTPYDAIEKAINDIPRLRKEQEWLKFFKDKDEIKEDWKRSWIESGLTINQAETAYKNGWHNDPATGIIKDRQIKQYKTVEYVDNQPQEAITENIDPLTKSAVEVDKAQKFIIRQIRTQTDLTKFPTDTDINGGWNDGMTPDTLEHEKIYKVRDNARIALFKKYFEDYHEEGQQPTPTQLSDKDIELWRANNTGLKMDGASQRKAFNNGWTKPSEIKDSKSEYDAGNSQIVKDVEVLKYKVEQIKTAIQQANQVISNIQAFKSLRELEPDKFKTNQTIIDNLKKTPQILPVGKLEEIDKAIKDANTNLDYHLNDPSDGGIDPKRLNEIEQSIRNEWSPKDYAPLTTEILNNFIKTYGKNSVKVKGEKEWKNSKKEKVSWDSPNIDEWLKDKGAYKFDEKITKAEEKLPLAKKGRKLLPESFKKANFNVDKLGDRNSYCETELDKDGDPQIKGTQGQLPFVTGGGKSTRVPNCFTGGGEKDEIRGGQGNRVILVEPDQFLVEAIGDHQSGWLQTWGCVIHGDEISAKVKKGTFVPATEEEIKNNDYETKNIYKSHGRYKVLKNKLTLKTEKGLSIITGNDLIGFMARDLLLADPSDPVSKWQPVEGATGWFNTQDEINNWRKEAESQIIDKNADIIMFDEKHFAIPAYQALQRQVINAGYRVILMSATIEGQPFSITTIFPRTNLYAGYGGRDEVDPKMMTGKIRINKVKQIERLADLRSTTPEALGWDSKTKNPIEIEVNTDERLQIGKTAMFVPNLVLTSEQQRELADISWIAYTSEWDPYLEPASYGMSIGCLNILGQQHGVGTNGDFDTVILGGKMWVKSLKKRFNYDYEDSANLNQADGIQQIGRVARSYIGTGIILSPKWEELNTKDDVSAAMVNACFNRKVTEIYKKGYEMIQDVTMLRTALAIPYRFGKKPEVILIGLKVDDASEKDRVANSRPLTRIDWRKKGEAPEAIKIFGVSLGKPDPKLWEEYLGDKPPITMKREVAKERLLQNISTFILEDVNFPEKVEVWRQSTLIEYIWGEDMKTESGKKTAIAEVREVLNGVIKKGIDSFKSEDYNSVKKISKKKEVIKKVASYYNIADAFIDISPQKNEEGKMVLTLQIEKPQIIRDL